MVALAVLVWGVQVAGAFELYPPRVYPVGSEPYGIAAADFDLDGKLDVATANYNAGHISVLFGIGDGTFGLEVRIAKPYLTTAGVLAVDLNEDGAPDLVVVARLGMSVLLNNGDRTFSEEIGYGSEYRSLATADFNRDGHADLAVGSGYPGSTRAVVYLGNGNGTFAPESSIPGVGADLWLVAGDFDGDDQIDLAGNGSVLLGRGDGTFEPPMAFSFGGWRGQAEDFDGDGLSDLASASGGKVSVWLATGEGHFAPAVQYVYSAVSDFAFTSLGDVDRDGDRDLVIAGLSIYGNREVTVLPSNGDGTFAAAVKYETPLLGGPVVTADFDSDGWLDVAVASHWGTTGSKVVAASMDFAFVLLGDGRGGFIGQGVPRFKVGNGPESIGSGDFNDDGNPDLVTANSLSHDVSVALGDGSGGFTESARIAVGTSPVSLAVGRFDAGDTDDVAVAAQGSSEISLLLGSGDGMFAPGPPLPLGRAPVQVVTADFNGDEIQDLATANPDTDDVSVVLGVGDGSFGTPSHLPVGDRPVWLAVADLDEQSGLDLAVVHGGIGEVSLLLGNGDGTFGAETRFPIGAMFARSIAAADLNADGNADLAIAVSGFHSLMILYGDGAGGVSAPLALDIGAVGNEVAIGDLDGDGREDLAVSHNGPMVSVLLQADGGFDAARGFLADDQGSLTIADLDRDGNLDLAVSGEGYDRVSILLNRMPPHLGFDLDKDTLTWRMRASANSYEVYRGDLADLVDLDGDGLVDGGYGVCMTGLDPDPTDNVFWDAEVPNPGEGYFYLMALVDEQGEHGLGETSAGHPRLPAVPCMPGTERRPVTLATTTRCEPPPKQGAAFEDLSERGQRWRR